MVPGYGVPFDTYRKNILNIMEDPWKVMRVFMNCKSSQAHRTYGSG